jgi:ATP-binding cassette subfamily F protein 3
MAIVGANGAGKTTLLRLLAGQLLPRTGERTTFAHTHLAYFAQHAAETLEPDQTVLGTLETTAPPAWRPRLRSLLGSFLFSGDDVSKFCRVLSGGERQRVALARILMESANLLLLDEPTHHLDIAGKEVLEEALEQYPGAVVVVTHDRSLMVRLATRIVEVNEGRVVLYPGGYDDYEAARIVRAAQLGAAGTVASAPRLGTTGSSAGSARASGPDPNAEMARRRGDRGVTLPARAAARRAQAERQRREREVARIEKDIQLREAKIEELSGLLADPDVYADGSRTKELVSQYERVRAELESLWQRLGEL